MCYKMSFYRKYNAFFGNKRTGSMFFCEGME